jgi:hypothetical protein
MGASKVPVGWRFDATGRDPQAPADAAVVLTTILRPSLRDAIESVYAQDMAGSVQLLIGIDKASGPLEPLMELLQARPANVAALILDPGYSTSERHGGVHLAHDGGALRTILSFLANSRRIAYLDDDNRWLPNHLSSLQHAIHGFDWAYSLRMFVDSRSGADLCVDEWDSVGPGKGLRRDTLGGFVDVNCMMIDKTRAEDVLADWSRPLGDSKVTADRRVFSALRARHPHAPTGLATVRYAIRPTFFLWPQIMERMRGRGDR